MNYSAPRRGSLISKVLRMLRERGDWVQGLEIRKEFNLGDRGMSDRLALWIARGWIERKNVPLGALSPDARKRGGATFTTWYRLGPAAISEEPDAPEDDDVYAGGPPPASIWEYAGRMAA